MKLQLRMKDYTDIANLHRLFRANLSDAEVPEKTYISLAGLGLDLIHEDMELWSMAIIFLGDYSYAFRVEGMEHTEPWQIGKIDLMVSTFAALIRRVTKDGEA